MEVWAKAATEAMSIRNINNARLEWLTGKTFRIQLSGWMRYTRGNRWRRAQERDSRWSELRGCLTTGRRRAPHSSSPIRPVPTLIRPPTLPSPPLSVLNLPFRHYECVTSHRSLRTNPKNLFRKVIDNTWDKQVKRLSLHLCRKIICQRIGACRTKGETQEVRKRACACSGQSLRLTT